MTLRLLAIVAALAAGCAPHHPSGVVTLGTDGQVNTDGLRRALSPTASNILAALAGRDIESLSGDWPQDDLPQERSPNLEWVFVQSLGDVAADGYRFTLLVDAPTARFWLLRSGGIAGHSDLRGPMMIDHHGVIVALPHDGSEDVTP